MESYYQPSFFEDPSKPSQIWQKPTVSDNFRPGLSTYFFKKKSKKQDFNKRFYTFNKDSVYYRKVNNFIPFSLKISLFFLKFQWF